MYKVNDKVYLFLKGTPRDSFALNGLHRNRFGVIKNIKEDNDSTEYEIELDTTGKSTIVSEERGFFTFYNMNELLDTIMSLDISIDVKEKYTELINDILQGKEVENKQYKF